MFQVIYRKEALKTLFKLPRNTAKLIREKLEQLAQDPFAPNQNVKALQGEGGFRLRVGDWRIIYELHPDRSVIEVLRIGPRGGIYK